MASRIKGSEGKRKIKALSKLIDEQTCGVRLHKRKLRIERLRSDQPEVTQPLNASLPGSHICFLSVIMHSIPQNCVLDVSLLRISIFKNNPLFYICFIGFWRERKGDGEREKH